MATLSNNLLLTARDLEILTALDRCPLTAEQLLKLSRAFAAPFTSERRVRERLQQLAAAGRVRRWLYATAGRGALGYYTLSRLGHQLLRADEAAPAPKRAFGPVGIARQFHALRLADFIVHTATSAPRTGLKLAGFYRENALRLTVGSESLYPDCAFQLVTPSGFPFSFFVELDNSTEAIRSDKDRDSWERKLRLYDAFQDTTPVRFRVLVLTTRSSQRVGHVLDAAKAILANPQRGLVYGAFLDDFLARPVALFSRPPRPPPRARLFRSTPVLDGRCLRSLFFSPVAMLFSRSCVRFGTPGVNAVIAPVSLSADTLARQRHASVGVSIGCWLRPSESTHLPPRIGPALRGTDAAQAPLLTHTQGRGNLLVRRNPIRRFPF